MVSRPRTPSPRPPLAAHAALLCATLGLTSCGVRKGAPDWIGVDAAVVRCTVSGPNLALPQLFVEVPSPLPPTGLYARAMDPIALDQLGYERDRAVCATLQAPDAAELDAAATAIDALIETRNETTKRARKLGRCLCNYADVLDSRTLVPGCAERPTQRQCEAEPEAIAALAELLTPLRESLEAAEVPRLHWRLAGRTDRRGRFAVRHDELLGRHPGGSEVYLPATPLPPYPGMALVAALLAEDHVEAVVRQDNGRALLVVREIDDELVLDHFAYPDWLGADVEGVDPELSALLPHLDDAQIERYREALAPPSQTRDLLFRPHKGYMVELDRAALERVDRAVLLAAHYAGHRYDPEREVHTLPPRLADRFAHQIPYGTEGEVLRARVRLTDEGRQWIGEWAEYAAFESLSSLGQDDVVPAFEPATQDGVDRLFVLRGQPIESVLFAGVSALPKVLFAVELAASGSVDGPIGEFEVELPSGPLPGEFPTRRGIGSIRERLSKTPHELEVELVEGGREIALELTPQ